MRQKKRGKKVQTRKCQLEHGRDVGEATAAAKAVGGTAGRVPMPDCELELHAGTTWLQRPACRDAGKSRRGCLGQSWD